ncbi:MAG: GNAT family N-acetyltransferase [Pseudomonas marincola]
MSKTRTSADAFRNNTLRKVDNVLIIRHATETDFDQWRALWDQYNVFYGRVGPAALPEEIVLSTWKRFFQPTEPVHCLVGEYAGKLVGLAHYIFHRNTITVENTCYLQDLFSDVSLRGKGIGRALIIEFEKKASQGGAVSVYWHTHTSNEPAMMLYDRVATNTEFTVYRKTLSKNPT